VHRRLGDQLAIPVPLPSSMSVPDEAAAAIERRDWNALKPLLHPYLHWRRFDGRVIQGRTRVLAYLAKSRTVRLGAVGELRDGQVYRCQEAR
jgi:hypothetical protein